MNWISIHDRLPSKAGWYAAALNPVNASEVTLSEINAWRKQFGFTKAWFTPRAQGSWWEPDHVIGRDANLVGERVTHWAELPEVPVLLSGSEEPR